MPPELRNNIYHHALGGHKFHVVCKKHLGMSYPNLGDPPKDLTVLIQVCRQVHSEVSGLFVALNIIAGSTTAMGVLLERNDRNVIQNVAAVDLALWPCFPDYLRTKLGLNNVHHKAGRVLRAFPNLKSVDVCWGHRMNVGVVYKALSCLVENVFRLASHVRLRVPVHEEHMEF